MTLRALLLIATLAAPVWTAPAAMAQDSEAEPGLMDGLLGTIMENMLRDVGPEMDQMGDGMSGALSRLGPVLKDLSVLVDDLRNYQAPERLENGDILIRRRADAPPPPPIGDNLRDLTTPDTSPDARPDRTTPDPTMPEFEL